MGEQMAARLEGALQRPGVKIIAVAGHGAAGDDHLQRQAADLVALLPRHRGPGGGAVETIRDIDHGAGSPSEMAVAQRPPPSWPGIITPRASGRANQPGSTRTGAEHGGP